MINTVLSPETASAVLKLTAQVIGTTYGPNGKLIAINNMGEVNVTKDGVSVLNSMESNDPHEDAFLNIIKEASMNTMSRAGDGTTATIILANAIVESGIDLSNAQDYVSFSNKFFDGLSESNVTEDMIKKLVLTSTNWDEDLSAVISEAGAKAKSGIVISTPNVGGETKLSVKKEVNIPAGLMSGEFIDDIAESETIMKDPAIVILGTRLDGESDLLDLIDTLIKDEVEDVVILCPEVEIQSLSILKVNHLAGTIKILPMIIGPVNKGEVDGALKDLSVVTGAVMLGASSGQSLTTAKPEHFGSASEVIYSKGKLIIRGAKGNAEDREALASSYENSIPLEKDEMMKEILSRRASIVRGETVEVLIGGENSSYVQERKDRADDAIGAMMNAKKFGVLPGGGMAYAYLGSQPFMKELKDAMFTPLRLLSMDTTIAPTFELYSTLVSFDFRNGIVDIASDTAPIDSLATVKSVTSQAFELARLISSIRGTVSIINGVR